MRIFADAKANEIVIEVPRAVYGRAGFEVAAVVLAHRAEAFLETAGTQWRAALKPPRPASIEELEKLGGEFLNELLNQEYRLIVNRFQADLAGRVVTQTLYAARPRPRPQDKKAEAEPRFRAEVAELMRETTREIEATMPKKLPPQGTPLPPAPEAP